jgi:hypothetical protein
MIVAGILGAGEGQGLAAGGIVVGYGFIAGVLGLILAIIFVGMLERQWIIRLNIVFGVLLLIAAAALIYRIVTLNKAENDNQLPDKELTPTKPMSLYEMRGDEGDIGLGFYTPDFYEHKVIYFYPEPTKGKSLYEHQAYDSLVFGHSEMDTYEISYAPPYLVPAHLKMDYELILFRVKRISKEYFEIVVNETTGRTAFIDRFKGGMIHWPEFLVTLPSVEFPDGMIQPYRVKPLDHASEVKTEKVYPMMRPESVRGYWLEVSLLNENYRAEDRVWIKWRDRYQLLIEYSLLS